MSLYTDAWNKGLSKESQPRFGAILTDETRSKMSNSAKWGVDNNLYIDGRSNNSPFRLKVWQWQHRYKNRIMNDFGNICAVCKINSDDLELDHIKPVSKFPDLAFNLSNIQPICTSCHLLKTKEERKSVGYSMIKTIEYIGDEETYDMEVDSDSHNYIADGIVVHNSQRYQVSDKIELCIPRRQDVKNRQNSLDDLTDDDKNWFIEMQEVVWDKTQQIYKEALERGIAKECARFVLPENTQTRLFMTAPVRSWIHFLDVRCHEHAQKEIRDIADNIKLIFCDNFPLISKALNWN